MPLSSRPALQTSLLFLLAALLCIPFADLQIYPSEPLQELARIAKGVITPQWYDWPGLAQAVVYTLAFAFVATSISVALGLLLATLFNYRVVRVFCASIRAVHELFWGLIFMQVFGLSALTGVLAIAVPYTGIFAKIFAEILEQQSLLPEKTLCRNTGHLSRWVYARLAQSLPSLTTYIRYRFECALRSSTILGFIGLPTLGFYFETAFKQGQYSEAACLLWVFYLLIASLKFWLHWKSVLLFTFAAFFLLPESAPVYAGYFWQFISQDIWPQAIQEGAWLKAIAWYGNELIHTLLPAIGYTVILSLVALVASGILAMLLYPLASKPMVGSASFVGHGFLLILRSTPEMVIAFVLLLLFGPSALPAVIALAIHTSGLVAYLIARESERLPLRIDAPSGINLYSHELTPRLFPRMLSLLLYRWEVIMRETAILGLLGVATLGFYVDSAFEEIRYDKALLVVVAAATLNIGVDWFSRRIRLYCRLHDSFPTS
ncbi:PhnE/PtxC family ABC transporter permease [Teredinibacter franksiae]|uniref:PhnE/PtxC family ABC transporter permease n=1 Tax=Teredinibacter franksiae TaxID=2761453 RepID=UPI001FE9CCFF|nr:hypothetical protein [Teredinibacter franksiae]